MSEPCDAGGLPPLAAYGLLLALFALCYAPELTTFNLSIDEELFAFDGPRVWIALGRWAQYLVKVLIWPQSSVPFGPLLLFGMAGAWGYLLLLRAFGMQRPRPIHLLIFPVFIAFPVWFTQIEFSILALGDGLGLLACCAATLLAAPALRQLHEGSPHPGFRSYLAAAALCAFAIGVYQTFVFLHLVLGLALSLSLYLGSRQPSLRAHLRASALVLLVALAGLALSTLAGKLMQWIVGVEPSGYLGRFVQTERLLEAPLQVLYRLLSQLWGVYTGYWSAFGLANAVFFALFALGALLLLGRRPRLLSERNVTLCCTLTVIGLIPFAFNPIAGGQLPLRAFVAVPAIAWLFLFLPLRHSKWPKAQAGVLIMTAALFVQIVYVQSLVQARAWAVRQHDLQLAAAIHARVEEVRGPLQEGEKVEIQFSGYRKTPRLPYPQIPTSTSGASFFAWDLGSPSRMVRFMQLTGYDEMVLALAQPGSSWDEAYARMPSWPAQGAVRLIGGVVLVKLSEPAAGP